jgi:hypothetical protein
MIDSVASVRVAVPLFSVAARSRDERTQRQTQGTYAYSVAAYDSERMARRDDWRPGSLNRA